MRIFAFAGPARAGKTSAADFLQEECEERGFYVERVSFAGILKSGCERLGITKERDEGEYRALAQRWGQSRRERDPDYWVKKTVRKINKMMKTEHEDFNRFDDGDGDCWEETVVIIDDVRYPNEVDAVNKLGGTVVFIDPGKRVDMDAEWRSHESETMANKLCNSHRLQERFVVELGCYWIMNDQSEDHLEAFIELFAEEFWFNSIISILEE